MIITTTGGFLKNVVSRKDSKEKLKINDEKKKNKQE
jgi:hypothetical protein